MTTGQTKTRWFLGADHAGVSLKQDLAALVAGWGDEVVDLGPATDARVDYPDFAVAVARRVAAEPGTLGLLVCGSGIGMSISANKVAGVRAAVVNEPVSARLSREHNDANVLCLGQRLVGPGMAEECVRAFRDGVFAGGRHQGRVDKMRAQDAALAGGQAGPRT